MPAIIVKDYTWRQNHDFVIISTPLVGNPKKMDLFAIENYMKASYAPFILELFLWGSIMDESSECTIGDETIVFTLRKKEAGIEWPSLLEDNLDKEKKRSLRSRALDIAHVSAEDRNKARSNKRQTLQRQAVKAQINLDTEQINKIDCLRNSHRKEAMDELEDWRLKSEKPILENIQGNLQENRNSYRPPLKWFEESKTKNEEILDVSDKIKNSNNVDSNSSSKEVKNSNMSNSNSSSKEVKNSNMSNSNSSSEKAKNSNMSNSNSGSEKAKNSNMSNSNSSSEKAKNSNMSNSNSSSDEIKDSNIAETNSSSSSNDSSSEEDLNDRDLKTFRSVSELSDEKVQREIARRKKRENKNRGKEIVRRVLSTEKSKFLGKRQEGIFEENGVAIPRPRRSCIIDVKFTDRPFPTPARESHHLEEQEWLEKQAEARRKSGFVSEDLRPEEQDPQWLKEKGDEFFKAGNYLGAISAYSHGIKLSEKMSSLYVNRSAAHYASGNYQRCAEDCSKALELMAPKCEANRESRARCHARLGAALCKLSAPQHGIPELEAALKLEPENESIKRDLKIAKRYFDLKD